jgi:hypothetical protein
MGSPPSLAVISSITYANPGFIGSAADCVIMSRMRPRIVPIANSFSFAISAPDTGWQSLTSPFRSSEMREVSWSAERRHRQCVDKVCDDERERAWRILSTHPVWGDPGFTAWAARAHRDLAEPFRSIYYRIRVDRVTGHEATRDASDAISYAVPGPPGWEIWMAAQDTNAVVRRGVKKGWLLWSLGGSQATQPCADSNQLHKCRATMYRE